MKRWAVLTVLLYAVALALLTLPVALVAFANWGKRESHFGLHQALQMFGEWSYWLWLAVLVAGQFLLLLLPIHIAERRLPARRPLKIPVLVTAFFLANLAFAGLFSILSVVFGDEASNYFNLFALFPSASDPGGAHKSSADGTIFTMIFSVIVFWILWAVVFHRATRADTPDARLQRATRWLLRGSILELIIAVPSHVIVRRRDDCCAPAGTFWGIATGISVMLLCFGPGVFFLFADRCRKLKPNPPPQP